MFICDRNHSCCNHRYWDRREDVEQDAKECGHLIEVVEVVHGEWIEDGYYNLPCVCSNCGAEAEHYRTPHCPNCGAKMDGERRGECLGG